MKYRNQAYVIFATSGHFFLNGLALGWMAPTIVKLQDPGQTTLKHPITDWEVSMLSAMTFGGIWIMALAGTICNRYGRKPVLFFGAVTRMVAWLILGLATDINVMLLGKILETHASALAYPTCIIYMSEITSINIRGFALTLTGLFSNMGILTMYIFGPFVTYTKLCLIPVGFSFIVGVLSFGIAESPMYFIMRGKTEAANRSLKYLDRSEEVNSEEATVMMRKEMEHQLNNLQRFKELFLVKRNLKAFCVTCFINIMQQFSGIVAVLFQMTTIFKLAGSSVEPHIATIIVGAIQVLSCLSASLLVERVGRRPLLLTSCFMTALANMALGLNFYLDYIESPVAANISWLPLASLIVFIVFYWNGLGVMPSTLTGELFNDQVKSLGSSIICTIEILSCISVVSTFSYLNTGFGSHTTFWVFSTCCAITFVFVSVFLPETKGKSSEEINELFT